MALPAFYMDKFPATNADYSAYLRATGYKPADAAHWLAHWHGASEPPAAIADAPVTYISLADARAYCGWRAGGDLGRRHLVCLTDRPGCSCHDAGMAGTLPGRGRPSSPVVAATAAGGGWVRGAGGGGSLL